MSLLPEIFFLLLMLGSVIAVIVAAIKEKKARAAASRMMQPAPMQIAADNGASDGFGNEGGDGFEFNVDSFK
ncbi:MAG: hypothetical protein U0930_13715 [Pirellulales bacterium]